MPERDDLLHDGDEDEDTTTDADEGKAKDKSALLLWSLKAWHKKKGYEDRGSRRKLRRLQSKVKAASEEGSCDLSSDGTIYGSVLLLQIKECSQETGSCHEFLWKSSQIITNTMLMTFVLGSLMVIPVGMISVGLKYLEECPVQPKIPIYLLVGGCFGLLKLLTLLFYQIRSRHYEKLDVEEDGRGISNLITSSKFMDALLTAFLIAWFICGNYWVLSIWQPVYHLSLEAPNSWCNKNAYIFAFVQLMVCYGVASIIVIVLLLLLICQIAWKCGSP